MRWLEFRLYSRFFSLAHRAIRSSERGQSNAWLMTRLCQTVSAEKQKEDENGSCPVALRQRQESEVRGQRSVDRGQWAADLRTTIPIKDIGTGLRVRRPGGREG